MFRKFVVKLVANIFSCMFFIIFFVNKGQGEELNYKIAVPEFICDKNGSVREIPSDMTTIRFLGKDANSLKYKFSVNYERIGGNCRNKQRCALMAWKLVREFEDYLKNYPTSQSGIIEFNNTMLSPGLKYIMNITVEKDGKIVERKQMKLDFVDEEVKKNVQKPMASILLLGGDMTYAYMRYIINAETTICSNVSNFYYKWELLDDAGAPVESFREKSAVLTIPPDTFQGGKSYTLSCSLMDAATQTLLATGSQTVSVAQKGILLNLPIRSLTTKTATPINIKAYIRDLDNQDGELKISWSCQNDQNQECNSNSDTSELNIEGGFPTEGKYKISVEASKGSYTETSSCEITTKDNVASIEIDSVETPISPSEGVEVRADLDLRTFCSLQWQCIKQPGFEFVDLNLVPGNVNEVFNVTLKEDLFLNELEEFSNGTVAKKHNLLIPPAEGAWQGLKGDSKYLFRLVVSCTAPLDDYDNDNGTDYLTEPVLGDPVITFADVAIETNAGPLLKPLVVNPTEGEAMKTSFNFKTQTAEDKDADSPFLYEFGYVLSGRELWFCRMIDVVNTNGVLPFSEGGVQTLLKGCDNFNSCSKVLGPVIKTRISNDIDQKQILYKFKEYLNTEDFYKAFVFAFSITVSYNSKIKGLQELFSGEINKKILETISAEPKDDFWTSTANNFIENLSEFIGDLTLSEEVLNNLVKLRTELANKSDQEKLSLGRKLLSTPSKSDDTLGDAKSYLQVSEVIILSYKDKDKVETEKEHLRKMVNHYLQKLCAALYQQDKKMQLELKTVILTVEKLRRNSFISYSTIPFPNNSWHSNARIKLNNNEYVKLLQNNKLCLARVAFKDYLNKTGNIFFVDVIDANEKKNLSTVITASVNLPLKAEELVEKSPKCVVYDGHDWKNICEMLKITSGFVQCNCKSLGYFFVIYESKSNITSTTITVSALITTSTTSVPTSLKTSSKSIKITTIFAEPTTENVLNPIPTDIHNINQTGNHSAEIIEEKPNNNDVLSYVLIALSIAGVLILVLIIRRMSTNDDEQNILMDDFDSPKYASLHNEELLTGSL